VLTSISGGYKEANGEYVRESILIQAKEVEKYVEKMIVDFFSELGYDIKRIKEGQDRSVDYKYEDVGFEITVIHEYLPRISEIDNLLSQHDKTDSKVCAYMYGENGKVKIKKIQETPMDKQSVLSIRQHISSYRPKLVNKLDDKYAQSEHSKYVIIVMDFRLARFDSLSIKREVSAILKENGASYSTLIGVLILSPEKKDSELYGKSKYVFVPNTHCVTTSPLIESLKKYSITSTDEWWTVNHVFIKTEHGKSVPIQYLQCLESKQELEKLGLPTFDL
jgi:hypothetical protein